MEQGSHAELIGRQGGAYATLVGLQMSALGAKQADGQQDVLEDEMVRPYAAMQCKVEEFVGGFESVEQSVRHETRLWSP